MRTSLIRSGNAEKANPSEYALMNGPVAGSSTERRSRLEIDLSRWEGAGRAEGRGEAILPELVSDEGVVIGSCSAAHSIGALE